MRRNYLEGKKGFKKVVLGMVAVGSMAMTVMFMKNVLIESNASPSIAGELSIVSGDGHSFLLYTNLDDESQKIVKSDVEPNETISIGTFGNADKSGVYIDLEAYKATVIDDIYAERVSLTTDITSSQIEQLNEEIIARDKWTLTKNCTWFAAEVWNELAPTDKQLKVSKKLPRPKQLSKRIKEKDSYGAAIDLPEKKEDEVLKYNSQGNKKVNIREFVRLENTEGNN